VNRLLQRHASRGLIFSLIVFAMLAASVFGGSAPQASAIQATSKLSQPAPILGHVPNAAQPDSFSVAGAYFTPGGKVYLAIYDQAGQALYENRWVNATKPLTPYEAGIENNRGSQNAVPSPGGAIHETFDHLCGVKAMIRALDVVTARWSDWIMIEPNCLPSNAAGIANDLNTTLKLPVAAQEPSAFAIATGQIAAIDPPLLLNATADGDASGVVTVSGFGFAAGHQVYIAVYDQMGAKIYPHRWLTAAHVYTAVGSSAASSEVPVIAKSTDGEFRVSFANLCGANVMIRAYDATTETWSGWLDVNNHCASDRAAPTMPSGQPAKS